jgi:hypothetical protein
MNLIKKSYKLNKCKLNYKSNQRRCKNMNRVDIEKILYKPEEYNKQLGLISVEEYNKQYLKSKHIEDNKVIYCITTGSYEDWHILYSFTAKEIRDKLLEMLRITDDGYYYEYDSYDLKLNDDIKIEDLEFLYCVKLHKDITPDSVIKIDFEIHLPITEKIGLSGLMKDIEVYNNKLTFVKLYITKEEYNKKDIEVVKKYINIFHQIEDKVKILLAEGKTEVEIENILIGKSENI